MAYAHAPSKYILLGLAAILGTAAAGSVTLTDSNFDAEVFDSGKNAIIKFQAPWYTSRTSQMTKMLAKVGCMYIAGEGRHVLELRPC
jgi:hypothetical protein